MTDFAHPTTLTAEQRSQNLSAMHLRMASAMTRVAADEGQSKAVRAANLRDAKSARRAARLAAG